MDDLKENEERLSTVLETLPVGVWITDREGGIIHGNAAAREIWAGDLYMGMLSPLAGFQATGSREEEVPELTGWAGAREVSQGVVIHNREVEIEAFDGTAKVVLVSAAPIDTWGRTRSPGRLSCSRTLPVSSNRRVSFAALPASHGARPRRM